MSSPWNLTPPTASLADPHLHASLDISRPQLGMGDVRPYYDRYGDARLFQLDLRPLADAEIEVADVYTRLGDLIVTYAETRHCPVSHQVYWRLVDYSSQPHVQAAVDLILSTQTSSLDAHPEIRTCSYLPATAAYHLVDQQADKFQRLDVAADGCTVEPATGAGCFLLRLENTDFSYVEMVHPTDFKRTELSPASEPGMIELRHHVIDRWMEKGVIVRGRARGAFVDRACDFAAAKGVYEQFQAARLPLTV
jgi:hypothetical protein